MRLAWLSWARYRLGLLLAGPVAGISTCALFGEYAYLALWYEDGDRMILARRDSKVCNALDPQLIPDLGQIVALVDLDFVGDDSSTEFLVKGILQIPACLGLLYESANGLFLNALGRSLLIDDQPDLEILDGVTVVVLGRSLPGDDVGSEGREA